jgi:hypothetical protein
MLPAPRYTNPRPMIPKPYRIFIDDNLFPARLNSGNYNLVGENMVGKYIFVIRDKYL